MEPLQQLTRRQLDALQSVSRLESSNPAPSLLSVAAEMGVRPPTALEHLTQLESLGLVSRYRGKTVLAPQGRATLNEYYRHHEVSERLFRQFGFSESESCRAAREVDLAISHRTIRRVARVTRAPSGPTTMQSRSFPA